MATKQTGISASNPMTPVELPYGDGCLVVSNASGLASAIQVTVGDDVWVPDKDATSPSANGAYPIWMNAPGYVKLLPSSGSCDVQVAPQSLDKYR